MQNNQKSRNKKEFALQQVKIARSNLLLMIILTVVNIVLLAVGADTMLLFSATVPYYLIIGVRFGYKLKNTPPEEAVEYEQSEQAAPTTDGQGNSVALRAVQNDVKNRILIDGNYLGHYICYRRAGHVNELAIDGYVYDELEILVETAHVLEATVDGYTIQAGFDGAMHSYICIDGQRVAKKIRLI